MKKVLKILLGVFLFIGVVFFLGYMTRVLSDLKETDIKENIIITFKGKSGIYSLNPNTEKFQSFSGSFNIIEKKNLELDTKVYSPNGEFYFRISGVYNGNNELLNRTWLCPIKTCRVIWIPDSKYLIRTDGHVVRLFGLFFSTPTLQQVLHIIEPSTGKSKQILLYDENGKLLEIEEILGYLENN